MTTTISTKSHKEMTDLQLCLEYQSTKKDKYFNEIVHRYHKFILKRCHTNRSLHPVLTMIGFDFNDVYVEILICIKKAMEYVDLKKLPQPQFFNFSKIAEYYITSWIGDQYKYANAKKRQTAKTTATDMNNMKSLQKGIDHVQRDIVEKETIGEFLCSLSSEEQEMLEDLKDRKTYKELYEKYDGWHYLEVKKSLHQKYKNHLQSIAADNV